LAGAEIKQNPHHAPLRGYTKRKEKGIAAKSTKDTKKSKSPKQTELG